MGGLRKRGLPGKCAENQPEGGGESLDYEKQRNARIEENNRRMQELGLRNLSQELSSAKRSKSQGARPPRPTPDRKLVSIPTPSRRSTRLQNATPVSYVELPPKWNEKSDVKSSRSYSEGSKPEIYTEEHEKLLGSCQSEWVLFQDGFGPDGKRIYDSVMGKTCHQCRQKTLGLRTQCSTCKLVQGQFCGDCLYMRYGENILEVNKNSGWVCPVCRGICNCSLCRLKKGWAPTGSFYRQVKSLGFQSVAHYLILTRQSSTKSEGEDTTSNDYVGQDEKDDVSPNSARRSLKFTASPKTTTESVCSMEEEEKEKKHLSTLDSSESEVGFYPDRLSVSSTSDTKKLNGDKTVALKTSLHSSEIKEEAKALPVLTSSKSEVSLDLEIISVGTKEYNGDKAVALKTSQNSPMVTEKQNDCDDSVEIVSEAEVVAINETINKRKKNSARSKNCVKGGIALRLRPRITTKVRA
eukprot:Gb_14071 [translate_table: standard]